MATDDHMKIEALGLPPGGEIMNFGRFDLENGFSIDEVVVGYTTYGTLNEVRRDFPAQVPADIFFTFYLPRPPTPTLTRPHPSPLCRKAIALDYEKIHLRKAAFSWTLPVQRCKSEVPIVKRRNGPRGAS